MAIIQLERGDIINIGDVKLSYQDLMNFLGGKTTPKTLAEHSGSRKIPLVKSGSDLSDVMSIKKPNYLIIKIKGNSKHEFAKNVQQWLIGAGKKKKNLSSGEGNINSKIITGFMLPKGAKFKKDAYGVYYYPLVSGKSPEGKRYFKEENLSYDISYKLWVSYK